MNRHMLWLFLLVALLCSGCIQPVNSPVPDHIQTFARDLEELRAELQIPGMSVAVLEGQQVIFAQGYGFADVEKQVPATENTPYEIASLTKPFAAAMIMQLVEAGRLDLDAVMAELLDETIFTFPPPADEPVHGYADLCGLVQELSRATSGPFAPFAYLFQDYHCDTNPITVKHHLTHTSQGVPGDEYRYNGFLYGLLSWVVVAAADTDFEQLLVQNIITPLAMTRTVPSGSESRNEQILTQIASPYVVDGLGNIVPADYTTDGTVNAAAGMVSTVLDLAKFDIAMDRNQLITAESKATMFAPTLTNDRETLPYGMGWFVQEGAGLQLIWHYGWEVAYSSLILKIPEQDRTLILLANSDGASAPFNLGAGDVMASPFASLFVELLAHEERAPDP